MGLDWELHWIITPPYYKNGKNMKQIMEHLVAAIGGLEAVIHNSKAKVRTEIKTNQEDTKEEMKAQVGSLAFRIDSNQEKTDAGLKEIIEEMRARRKETTTCQEATEACLSQPQWRHSP
jgi:hypothetical protein